MKRSSEHRLVRISRAAFRRLIGLYPRNHQAEYGPAMEQLFGDQLREAWGSRGCLGLFGLWTRVLPDIAKTSIIEHVAQTGRRTFMFRDLFTTRRRPHLAGFAAFLFVAVTVAVLTFLMPLTYSSTTRLRLIQISAGAAPASDPRFAPSNYDPYFIQSEFERIQSDIVLRRAVEALNLNHEWGVRYTHGMDLQMGEAEAILKRRLEFRPVRNTSLIEIIAYSESPKEAAALANAVADSYRSNRAGSGIVDNRLVEIVDLAVSNPIPVRPNRALNIAAGAMLGIALGAVVGAVTSFLIRRRNRNAPNSSGPLAAHTSRPS